MVELLHIIDEMLKLQIRDLKENLMWKSCLNGEKVKKHENEAETYYVILEERWRHRVIIFEYDV